MRRLAFLMSSLPFIAFAWILPAKTIVQKTVENHGSGSFALEQEVSFDINGENLTLKEKWIIADDQTMFLTVQSLKDAIPSISLQFLYKDGQRFQIQPNGKTSRAVELEFIEKPFIYRTPESFAYFLKQIKVAPDGILSTPPLPAKTSDIKRTPETFLRYSRSGGVVNYAFGYPENNNSESMSPGVWIEQDAFVIRKIRYPSGAVLTASDYSELAKGIMLPKTKTLTWNTNKVSIKLINLELKKTTPPNFFKTSTLETTNDFSALSASERTIPVADFYTRFR